jgi:hypothetical protein
VVDRDRHRPVRQYVGVWRTFSIAGGGKTWTNMTVGIHPGDASDIVIDPMHPNTLYAGLAADPNSGVTDGIYKSTDSGTTWTLLNNGVLSGSPVGATIRLAIASSAPQDLYATVFDQNLGNGTDGEPHRYRTTNGGSSWSELTFPLNGNGQPDQELPYWHTLLAVDPANPQTVYLPRHRGLHHHRWPGDAAGQLSLHQHG